MQGRNDGCLQSCLRGDQDARQAGVVVDDVERAPADSLVRPVEEQVLTRQLIERAQLRRPALRRETERFERSPSSFPTEDRDLVPAIRPLAPDVAGHELDPAVTA